MTELDRRVLLTALAVGTASVLAGCKTTSDPNAAGPGAFPQPQPAPPLPVAAAGPVQVAAVPTETASPEDTETPSDGFSDPAPVSGSAQVFTALPDTALPGAIALTIDDGFNPAVVSAYVQFAQDSGTHLTFSPNGVYRSIWGKHADVLKPLIQAGQVQIGNHTYSHLDMKKMSKSKMVEEIERNDEWVQDTFGITTRPWLRPPFGFRDERTDEICGELGYTHVLMWNGSFGDAAVLTQDVLLQQARKWLRPHTIMLGHANHPAVTHLYPEIVALIQARGLTPQTLDEAFGTSRSTGF